MSHAVWNTMNHTWMVERNNQPLALNSNMWSKNLINSGLKFLLFPFYQLWKFSKLFSEKLLEKIESSRIFFKRIVFPENHSFYVVYQLLYKQFRHLICFRIQHKMAFYIFQGIMSWFPLNSWFWILRDFLSILLVKVQKSNCLDWAE